MITASRKLALAFCIILIVIIAAVWPWSYRTSIGLFSLPFDTDVKIRQGVIFWHHTYTTKPSIPANAWLGSPIPKRRINPPAPSFPAFRFSSGHEMGNVMRSGRIQPAVYWMLLTPLWFFLLIFAAYPFIFAIYTPSRRRRQRAENGLCIRCGYDLRGSSGSQCPECGEAVYKPNSEML